MSKKVLVVEDGVYMQREWRRRLDGRLELISAYTIADAKEMFSANSDIVAIVMDACVPGTIPNTSPLVREFRKSFTGPMIAVSSESGYRQMLVRAGCNCESTKDDLPAKLLEVLGL